MSLQTCINILCEYWCVKKTLHLWKLKCYPVGECSKPVVGQILSLPEFWVRYPLLVLERNVAFFSHTEIPLAFLTIISPCFSVLFWCHIYFWLLDCVLSVLESLNFWAMMEVTFWLWKHCKIWTSKAVGPKQLCTELLTYLFFFFYLIVRDCQYLMITNANPVLTTLRESWTLSSVSCFGKNVLLCSRVVVTAP